jgi:hypothetical protein
MYSRVSFHCLTLISSCQQRAAGQSLAALLDKDRAPKCHAALYSHQLSGLQRADPAVLARCAVTFRQFPTRTSTSHTILGVHTAGLDVAAAQSMTKDRKGVVNLFALGWLIPNSSETNGIPSAHD